MQKTSSRRWRISDGSSQNDKPSHLPFVYAGDDHRLDPAGRRFHGRSPAAFPGRSTQPDRLRRFAGNGCRGCGFRIPRTGGRPVSCSRCEAAAVSQAVPLVISPVCGRGSGGWLHPRTDQLRRPWLPRAASPSLAVGRVMALDFHHGCADEFQRGRIRGHDAAHVRGAAHPAPGLPDQRGVLSGFPRVGVFGVRRSGCPAFCGRTLDVDHSLRVMLCDAGGQHRQ